MALQVGLELVDEEPFPLPLLFDFDEKQMSDKISRFLDGSPFAVLGASSNRSKFGNKVLRSYMQDNRTVIPINPNAAEIEGLRAYARLSEVSGPIHGLSIVTPPRITESIIEQAGELGIKHVWIQPGAQSNTAIRRANELGMNLIAGGPCLLVEIGFPDD